MTSRKPAERTFSIVAFSYWHLTAVKWRSSHGTDDTLKGAGATQDSLVVHALRLCVKYIVSSAFTTALHGHSVITNKMMMIMLVKAQYTLDTGCHQTNL